MLEIGVQAQSSFHRLGMPPARRRSRADRSRQRISRCMSRCCRA